MKYRNDNSLSTEEKWLDSGDSLDDISNECIDDSDNKENIWTEWEYYQNVSSVKQSD